MPVSISLGLLVSGGGGLGAFEPESLSGLTWWVRTDAEVFSAAGSIAATNGTSVQEWWDQQNDNDLTQANASIRPIFRTDQRNGLPALDFTGNKRMDTDSIISLSSFHIFAIVRPDQLDGATAYSIINSPTTGTQFALQGFSQIRVIDNNGDARNTPITPHHTASAWYSFEFGYDGTCLTAWRNGDVIATNARDNDTWGVSRLGTFVGQKGDVLIYNRNLSETERVQVCDYLHTRWNHLWRDSTPEAPFMDIEGTAYKNVIVGGMWAGSNGMPTAHYAAGVTAMSAIVPRDSSGSPDAENGLIGVGVQGISNTRSVGTTWLDVIDETSTVTVNTKVRAFNAGVGGANVDGEWQTLSSTAYASMASAVSSVGLTASQVQVLMIEHGMKGSDESPVSFTLMPESNSQHEQFIQWVCSAIRTTTSIYPNIKQIWFINRINAYNSQNTAQNKEPYVFEQNVGNLVIARSQHVQRSSGVVNPLCGDLVTSTIPWVGVNTLLDAWTHGEDVRSYDGFQYLDAWIASDDGVHPFGAGKQVVAERWFQHLATHPLCSGYFLE